MPPRTRPRGRPWGMSLWTRLPGGHGRRGAPRRTRAKHGRRARGKLTDCVAAREGEGAGAPASDASSGRGRGVIVSEETSARTAVGGVADDEAAGVRASGSGDRRCRRGQGTAAGCAASTDKPSSAGGRGSGSGSREPRGWLWTMLPRTLSRGGEGVSGGYRRPGHNATVEVVGSRNVVVRYAAGDSVADVAGLERLERCLLRTRLWGERERVPPLPTRPRDGPRRIGASADAHGRANGPARMSLTEKAAGGVGSGEWGVGSGGCHSQMRPRDGHGGRRLRGRNRANGRGGGRYGIGHRGKDDAGCTCCGEEGERQLSPWTRSRGSREETSPFHFFIFFASQRSVKNSRT